MENYGNRRGKLWTSKVVAWMAMIIILAAIVVSMTIPGVKTEWWQLIDLFFFFMMAFCHIAALYLERMSKASSHLLEQLAFIFGILGVIAMIAVFVITNWG